MLLACSWNTCLKAGHVVTQMALKAHPGTGADPLAHRIVPCILELSFNEHDFSRLRNLGVRLLASCWPKQHMHRENELRLFCGPSPQAAEDLNGLTRVLLASNRQCLQACATFVLDHAALFWRPQRIRVLQRARGKNSNQSDS